ncbi:Hok/Gef family protein [Vibrio parahaemolyticus]|nr:Hok/Gef family protein [Vibrio parahaemolyticus]
MYKQLDNSLLLHRRQVMPKKTALTALVVVCITAVILTALYTGSLCDIRYKDQQNDLSITLAYEVR